MQTLKPPKLILNLLVLITVIGLVLFGWLVGHILRFSIPEFWHPPIEEINPQIKNTFEFENQRTLVPQNDPRIRVYVDGALLSQSLELNVCQGNTYYTSLPAKCRSVDGKLVQVGGAQFGNVIIPPGK
jgi:hypothetical protein